MSRTVNLEIETEVLTSGGLAEIVNAILECLLYQRNQIDLVYSTFRGFINEWLAANETKNSSTDYMLHDYMLNRQREKAIQTKESISAMRQLIMDAFKEHDIRSLRFLFGSTISTPKEVYTVHLPTTTSFLMHLSGHHPLHKMHLNQLLISLVTHEELDVIFSKNLCPTNLFLEFEILSNTNKTKTKPLALVFPTLEKTQLPKSCKDIHFHLFQKQTKTLENVTMNCCRKLEVFHGENLEKSPDETYDNSEELTASVESTIPSTWWESEIIVRGFKEKLVKGRSIWNK